MNNEAIEKIVETVRKTASIEDRIEDFDGIPVGLATTGESFHVLDKILDAQDRRADNPRRRKGTSCHFEVKSFIEHIGRHAEERSVVWADSSALKLVAVYNYNPKSDDPKSAGWGDHRAVYACPLSPEWKAWMLHDGAETTQEQFSDFIDARADDIVGGERDDGSRYPSAMEMVEFANNLQIFTKGTFVKRVNRTTGERELVVKEEQSDGSTPIPRSFQIGARVFEGGKAYRVEARIQFRIEGGRAKFSYSLHRRQEFVLDAFNDVRTTVAEATGLPVFAGTPEKS